MGIKIMNDIKGWFKYLAASGIFAAIVGLYLLQCFFFVLVFIPLERLDTLFSIALLQFWYYSTFLILVVFKYWLGDTNCSLHENSVSGHTSHHFYFALSSLYLTHCLLKNSSSNRFTKGVFITLTFLVTLFSIINLNRTYYFGFHSLKQMVYGSIFGILSHLGFLCLELMPLKSLKLVFVTLFGIAASILSYSVAVSYGGGIKLHFLDYSLIVICWMFMVLHVDDSKVSKSSQLS